MAGGLILWAVTTSLSQPSSTSDRPDLAAPSEPRPTPAAQSAGLPLAAATKAEASAPRTDTHWMPLASISGSAASGIQFATALDGPSLASATTTESPQARSKASSLSTVSLPRSADPAVLPATASDGPLLAPAMPTEKPAPRTDVRFSPSAPTPSPIAPATPAATPATPPAPGGPPLAPALPQETPAPRANVNPPPPASASGTIPARSPQKVKVLPLSIPLGSLLLYEDFSHPKQRDFAEWGENVSIRSGADRRNWIAPEGSGAHPIGRRLWLPNEFYFELRYFAHAPEVTRGILGWWREPLSANISLLGDQGRKYPIHWIVQCGADVTRLNPLGSSTLCARKYYHTIKLPDGTSNEVEVVQPTGMLRIDRDKQVIKVFLDRQVAAVGNLGQIGQLVGFEIRVVSDNNRALFFTDFKIAH